MKIKFVIFMLGLFAILSIANISCDTFKEEVHLKPMPAFSVTDSSGEAISDKQYQTGYAILFLPCQDEGVNMGIAGRIEEFEDIEGLSFNKLAILGEKSVFEKGNWEKIVDEKIRAEFERKYPEAFVLIFDDNSFQGGLLTDPEPKLNVNLDFVRQNLYQFVLGIESHEAVMESHRPESFLDPEKFLDAVSGSENSADTHYLLFVSAAGHVCDGKSFLKYFQERLSFAEGTSWDIVLDPSFSDVDRENLINNYQLIPLLKILPSEFHSSIKKLYESNYSDMLNFVLIYQEGKFLESYYINRCEAMYQLF